jgi:prolyl-tRNA synthetase
MRYSSLFGKTKRDAPSDIADSTLRLAFRAGLIRVIVDGQILFLPLAANVISQMFLMLRAGLSELGAQELRGTPDVNLDALAAAEIQSYKQLPARAHWRSGTNTRVHLGTLEVNLEAAREAQTLLERLAADLFEYADVEAKTAQDFSGTRLWYAREPSLDLEILAAKGGSYAATRAAASPFKNPAPAESTLAIEEVETPHCDTIEALAQYLNVPTSRTGKAIFYSSGERIIFAVVRGDLQLDEHKVKRALGLNSLRWATDEEVRSVGATPGYASPVGVRGATIIVDDSIVNSPNLVVGANKQGYHLLNTNVPRDYKPDVVADIALARAGDVAPDGSGELELVRGITVGRISAPRELSATFLDMNGKAQKPFGVTMELDLGALLLAHLGVHRDDKGIIWQRALAPYDVHIVAISPDKPEVAAALERIDQALVSVGLDALLDDRNESAGVKFNDADLIGLPLRVTVGPKTAAQNSVDLKPRIEPNARSVVLDALREELDYWTDYGKLM